MTIAIQEVIGTLIQVMFQDLGSLLNDPSTATSMPVSRAGILRHTILTQEVPDMVPSRDSTSPIAYIF